MTNKFNFFRSLSPENGSGMDRLCIEIDSIKSRKLFTLLFVLFLGIGQVWGTATLTGKVVYSCSPISIATSTSYAKYTGSVARNTSTDLTASADWEMTLGSSNGLGSNSNQKAKMILSNGSCTGNAAIAKAIGKETSSTYVAAMICTTALTNVGKFEFSHGGYGNNAPGNMWLCYSTDNWSTATAIALTVGTSGFVTFENTIASAKYAFVIYKSSYTTVKTPTFTFYEGTTGSGSPTASVSADPEEVEDVVAAGVTNQTIDLTYENISDYETEVTVHPNANGTGTLSPAWLTASVSDADDYATVTYSVAANEGNARTAYIKVYTTDGEKEAETIIPVSQVKYVAPTGTFNKFTGTTLTNGYYVICSGTSTNAMKNEVKSSRLDVATVQITNNTIENPNESVIWKLENLSGDDAGYFTLYNEAVEKYAAFTSSNGNANLIASVTNYAKFNHVSNSLYEFQNKGKTEKNLRYNSGYGFASYSTSTGATLVLYKKAAPKYAVTLSSTNCTLNVLNGSTAVSDGDEFEAGEQITVSATEDTGYNTPTITVKDADNNPVTVSNGKFTMPAKAVTITAIATKKSYTVTLSATNGHITVAGNTETSITVDHGETAELTAVEDEGYYFAGWEKSGDGIALGSTSDNPMTITVTGAGTVTANFQLIPAVAYSVTFDAGSNGTLNCNSCTNSALTEASAGAGVTLPSCTAEEGYGFLGWTATQYGTTVDDGANVGDTYHPTANMTLYAVYRQLKAVTLKKGDGTTVDVVLYEDVATGKVTLPSRSCKNTNYTFAGWSTKHYSTEQEDANASIIETGDYSPTDNVTLYPVFSTSSPVSSWVKKEASEINSAGVYALIDENGYAFNGTISSGRGAVTSSAFSFVNNVASTAPEGTCEVTFAAGSGGYTLYAEGKGYLYIKAASEGNLAWHETENSYWKYNSNVWQYAENSAALRTFTSNQGVTTLRTYSGATNNPIYFAKKESVNVTKYNAAPANDVKAPTFTPAAGSYYGTQSVTLSSETDNVSFYYTEDGTTTPTTASTSYSNSISVSSSKTIKAIAVDEDGFSSPVSTAEYTIYPEYSSIADYVAANAQASATAKVIINKASANAIVIGVVGAYSYIQDGTAAMVIKRPNNSNPWTVGSELDGFVQGARGTYYGLTMITVEDVANVTAGEGMLPTAQTISNLDFAGAWSSYAGNLIKVSDVYFQAQATSGDKVDLQDGAAHSGKLYDAIHFLGSATLPLTVTACDVTGILVSRTENEVTTYYIAPTTLADISTKGASAQLNVLPVGGADAEHAAGIAPGGQVTITPVEGFATTLGGEAITTIQTVDVTGPTSITVSASRQFYATNEQTYYYDVDASYMSVTVTQPTNVGGSTISADKTSAQENEVITLSYNLVAHYHFNDWNVYKTGDTKTTVPVENNQFSMPAYAVTVTADIAEDIKYTIAFNPNGATNGEAPSVDAQYANTSFTVPGKNTLEKTGYKFTGWKVGNVDYAVGSNFTTPETIPTEATTITFVAQWEEGGEFEWDATIQGYSNEKVLGTECTSPVTITFAKANAGNDPKYFTSDKTARFYTNGTLTITAPANILISEISFDTNISATANVGSYESGTWSGLAGEVIFTASATCKVKNITISYLAGTVTTLTIDNVAMKLSDDPLTIVPTCNVTPTPAISYVIAEEDQQYATIENGVITPRKKTTDPINVTASIAQGSNYTAVETHFTIQVTEKEVPALTFPQASYDANLGSDFVEPELTNPKNVTVAYSSSVEAVATVNASTGEITLVGEGSTVITATFAGNDDYDANTATYTLNVIDPYKDVLTASAIGQSGYGSWSGKKFTSDVEYAGYNTTGTGNNAGTIQMNSSPGGIVSTSTIGYLKSISATATKNGSNTLSIYAKNTKYDSSADLYDPNKQGTLIGTIAANGGEIAFETGKAYTDNYKYIGIKPNGGAVYYDDITIKWKPVSFEYYSVTYTAGTGATGENVVISNIEEGTNISLAAKPEGFAYSGHIFAGWKLNSEGDVLAVGSNHTVNANATFVAQWTPVYTITYKAGEGAEGEDVVLSNIEEGTNITLATKPEGFTYSGHVFAGWKLNGEGDVLAAGSGHTVNANANFVAQWTPIYTVTYKAGNGATGNDIVRSNIPAGEYTLEAQPEGFSKGLEAFRGWQVNGEGDVLTAGSTYALNSNTTFIAYWEAPTTCVLTLSRNGVTETLANPIDQAVAFDLSDYDAEETAGYAFEGWTDEPVEGDVKEINVFNSYTPAVGVTAITLYAVYSRVDASGAGCYVKATTVAAGDYLIVCESESKVFNGSLETLDASSNNRTATIADGTLTLANADNYVFTIAAITGGYSIQAASGQFIGNTGTKNGLTAQTDAILNQISISDGNAVITSGSTNYLKYNKSSGQERFRYFTSNSQENIQLYKKSAGTTYYATSPVEKVTVTFNANGGNGGCTSTAIVKGSGFTICEEIPTKYHKVFGGWKLNETSTIYQANQNIGTVDEDITLTAQWSEAPTYAVTYDVNGSEDDAPTQVAQYAGDQFTVAEGVTRNGYTFKGWQYNGKLYKEGKTFTMPAEAVTLVANWKKNNVSTEKMTLVPDASGLVNGAEVTLGCSYGESNFAMAGDITATNKYMNSISGEGISLSGNIATFTSSVITMIAEQVENGWRLRKDESNYLTLDGSDVKWDNQTNATVWNISFSEGNVIIANGNNQIKFNSGSPRFKTYTSTQTAIQLFSKATVITHSANISDLGNVAEEAVVASGENVTLTIDEPTTTPSITASSGATVVIAAETSTQNVVVEEGSKIVVEAPTTTPIVQFSATMGSEKENDNSTTSEIENADNIVVEEGGEIQYDITLNSSLEDVQADPNQWHAFTVPFEVDPINGVYNAATDTKLTNEVHYAIMEYDGSRRANGQYGWKKVRSTLTPGKFYLMTVDGTVTTFRFKKKVTVQTALPNHTSMEYVAYSGSGADGDQGWNGIGNPSWLGGKVGYSVQILDPYTYTFVTKPANSTNFRPSTPFFYKAALGGTMSMITNNNQSSAPRRTPAKEIDLLTIRFGNDVYKDKLYIAASEDALNEYENDKDLIKMIMSNTPKVAQIFGKAYGMKLSMVNMPLVNDQAEVAVSLYAPANGTYTIEAPAIENASVYLTFEGSIIWDLTMSAYELDLDKGTTEGYGLIMQAKAPQITTGISGTDVEAAGVQKVVINDHVYILRGGEMYDVTGKAVK